MMLLLGVLWLYELSLLSQKYSLVDRIGCFGSAFSFILRYSAVTLRHISKLFLSISLVTNSFTKSYFCVLIFIWYFRWTFYYSLAGTFRTLLNQSHSTVDLNRNDFTNVSHLNWGWTYECMYMFVFVHMFRQKHHKHKDTYFCTF